MAGGLTISTLNDSSGVLATQNGMKGIAKAWVRFLGGSTPTIQDSFNISSITYVSTGIYQFTFTTAMPNANYTVSGNGSINTASNGMTSMMLFANANASPYYQAPTASSFYCGWYWASAFAEPRYATLVVHSS